MHGKPYLPERRQRSIPQNFHNVSFRRGALARENGEGSHAPENISEDLVIIDIVFDLVDLCLKRATIEKSTSSSSSLIDCVRRLSFTAAQLLERVQSLQEYDKETSQLQNIAQVVWV